MSAETTDYTHEKGIKAIELLAKNADMLEQTANNLQDAVDNMHRGDVAKSLGFEVKSRPDSTGYDLTYLDKVQPVSSLGHTVRDYDRLHAEANKRAAEFSAHIIASLNDIGYITHIAHLDHRELEPREKIMLRSLPQTLDNASKLLDGYIANTTVTPENKKQVVQAKRDANYLRQLATQIGSEAPHVNEHNNRMIDREAELLTEDDITKARGEKFMKGMKMLGQSHDEAMRNNPSFRDRMSKRKPLELLASDPAECKGGGKEIA